MIKLFNDLHFYVKVHDNKTAAEINGIIADYASRDHSADQAFVFIIMSHGRLGNVYGIDGEPVGITDTTEKLARCQSLEGKPKMFFIQACQIGKVEGMVIEANV